MNVVRMLQTVADFRQVGIALQRANRSLKENTAMDDLELALFFRAAGIEMSHLDIEEMEKSITGMADKLQTHIGKCSGDWKNIDLNVYGIGTVSAKPTLSLLQEFLRPLLEFLPFGEFFVGCRSVYNQIELDDWEDTIETISYSSFMNSICQPNLDNIPNEVFLKLDYSNFDTIYLYCLDGCDRSPHGSAYARNMLTALQENPRALPWLRNLLARYICLLLMYHMKNVERR